MKTENNYNSIFAKRLRALLDETNTSQKILAEYVGVSHQSVSQWRNGQTVPDMYKFKKLAEFFNVSYDYLFGDTESRAHRNMLLVEQLGLSEMAVDIISVTEEKALLSEIIENKRFDEFLNFADEYLSACSVCKNDEERGKEGEYVDRVWMYNEREGAEFCKYRAIETVKEILNDIGNDDLILKKYYDKYIFRRGNTDEETEEAEET